MSHEASHQQPTETEISLRTRHSGVSWAPQVLLGLLGRPVIQLLCGVLRQLELLPNSRDQKSKSMWHRNRVVAWFLEERGSKSLWLSTNVDTPDFISLAQLDIHHQHAIKYRVSSLIPQKLSWNARRCMMGKLTAFDNGWVDYGLIMKRARYILVWIAHCKLFSKSTVAGAPWKAMESSNSI